MVTLNLTLGQCKFDLRSMSKTSKLCQVVYHSTRLAGTKVFKVLCGYSGSKGNSHKQNNVPYEKGNCNIWREIDDAIFILAILRSSTPRTRKLMTYFGS